MPDVNTFFEEMEKRRAAGQTNAPAAEPPQRLRGEEIAPAPVGPQSQFDIARQERGQTLDFATRNRQGDTPIDVTQGAPALVKFQVAFRRDPAAKVQYLEEMYGIGNVRLADDGTPLIKVPGPNNRVKEIAVDEEGLTWSDVASVAAHAPEIAGSIAALRAGRGAPFGIGKAKNVAGFLRDVVTSSVGGEVGGLAKDIAVAPATASAAEEARQMGKLAGERAAMIPADIAVGLGMGAVAAPLKVISPFAGEVPEVTARMKAGAKRLEDMAGLEPYPMTLGEATGSPLALRTEARMEKIPGATGRFEDVDIAKKDWFTKLQNWFLGLRTGAGPAERAALPSSTDVGSRAITELSENIATQKQAVTAAQANAQRALSMEVMDELAGATTKDRQIYENVVGNAIKNRVVAMKGAFDTKMDTVWGDLKQMFGYQDRIFKLPKLASAAKAELDSLPKDAAGKPSSQFTPSGVIGKLEELSEYDKGFRSLEDLRSIRTEVRNDIKKSEAIPGTQTHRLGNIINMLDDAIDEAATSKIAPTGLKPALDNAAKQYREGIEPFKEKYISRLFHGIDQPGFVADEAVVANISTSEYESYKRMLGETSPEFTNLKRSIVDGMLKKSMEPGGDIINGPAFKTQLDNLHSGTRTKIFEELFPGSKYANLKKLTDQLELTELPGGERLADSKLDAGRLREILSDPAAFSKSETRRKIVDLVVEQEKLDATYRTKLLKSIGDGTVNQSFGDAATFVSRFVDSASPEEIASVMSRLSPGVREDVQRKAVQKVLFDAQSAAAKFEPAGLGAGEASKMASERKLQQIFGDENRKKTLLTLLGEDNYKAFEALADVLAGTQRAERTFAASGGIAAGMFVGNMIHDPLKYGPEWVKQKIASIFITTPVLHQYAMNRAVTSQNIGQVTRTLLGSREFLEAANEEFGDRQLPWVLATMNNSIDRFEATKGQKGKKGPSAEEFIRSREGKQTNVPAEQPPAPAPRQLRMPEQQQPAQPAPQPVIP